MSSSLRQVKKHRCPQISTAILSTAPHRSPLVIIVHAQCGPLCYTPFAFLAVNRYFLSSLPSFASLASASGSLSLSILSPVVPRPRPAAPAPDHLPRNTLMSAFTSPAPAPPALPVRKCGLSRYRCWHETCHLRSRHKTDPWSRWCEFMEEALGLFTQVNYSGSISVLEHCFMFLHFLLCLWLTGVSVEIHKAYN